MRTMSQLFIMAFFVAGSLMSTVAYAVETQEDETVYRYICACSMASGCNLSTDHPGVCPCGKPLLKKRVLRETRDFYYVSASGKTNCDCTVDPDNIDRCTCGKELHPLAKKGKTACDCFGSGAKTCPKKVAAHGEH